MRRRAQPEIAEVVALAYALDRSEKQATSALTEREKRMATLVRVDGQDGATVALAWLEAVEEDTPAVRSVHHRADAALHLTGLLIVLAAVVIGWVATLGAFYFDGSGRVNAVSVLTVLVVVPGFFLIPFFLAALPSAVAQKVPGVLLLTKLSGTLGPGRLVPFMWRIFPRDLREAVSLLSGRLGKHHRLFADLQTWAILRWTQMFAFTFQITALVACLLLVVFTDLAFGWSSTLTTGDLSLDAQRVQRITSTMASPWGWIREDAQPSRLLIEESRYFRSVNTPLSTDLAARLGGWWIFVVVSIAVYGVLPRSLTYGFSCWRLRRVVSGTVGTLPGLSAVLRRIHRAQLQTVAVEGESQADGSGQAGNLMPPSLHAPIQAVVNWAEVPVAGDALATAFPGAERFAAGGNATVSVDSAVCLQLGAHVRSVGGDVLVLVKGWEPPLMEFVDFLATLRRALPAESTPILVLPLGLEEGPALSAATASQVKLWRDKLSTMGDPWLGVASRPEEVIA